MKRRNMRVSLKNYLHKVPSIDGVPSDLSAYVSAPVHLADVYRAIVRIRETGGEKGATPVSFAIGPLFAEIFRATCEIQSRSKLIVATGPALFDDRHGQPDDRVPQLSAFGARLAQPEVVDWFAQETTATANLLAEAYVKASAELKVVCERSQHDTVVISHHASLLLEITSDMLALVIEGDPPSDLRLSQEHAHRSATSNQFRARGLADFSIPPGADGAGD